MASPLCQYRCFNPKCSFMCHTSLQFGAFCCLKCHRQWVMEKKGKIKHGGCCEERASDDNSPVSPWLVLPQKVWRSGAKACSAQETDETPPLNLLTGPFPKTSLEPLPRDIPLWKILFGYTELRQPTSTSCTS